MNRRRSDWLWVPTFAMLVAFAVPWPLWGVDVVVAGLPVWIWWHVVWLVLCSLLFHQFARSGAWERGMGLATGDDAGEKGRERRGGETTDEMRAGGDAPADAGGSGGESA